MGSICITKNTMNYVEDFRPPYFYKHKELEFKEMEVFEH